MALLTHISGHPSAAGRAQDRESSPARDRRSTTVPRHQPTIISDCETDKTSVLTKPIIGRFQAAATRASKAQVFWVTCLEGTSILGSDEGTGACLEGTGVLGSDERERAVEIVLGHATDRLGRVALAVGQKVVHAVPLPTQTSVHVLQIYHTERTYGAENYTK